MFNRSKAWFGLICLFLVSCAHVPPEQRADRPFNYSTDTFGFANETVWRYEGGKLVSTEKVGAKDEQPYSRRCFIMVRAAMQFWKFARFEPKAKKLSTPEIEKRIRQVCDLDVWEEPSRSEQRITFPGYSSLKELSQAHPKSFQDHIGLGWPTYFRVGNYPMIIPPTRSSQKKICGEISADLQMGYPSLVWLINFPSLSINHAVLVYRGKPTQKGWEFEVYDPNYKDSPKKLYYDSTQKKFSYQKTFYFSGGDVDVRVLYRSPIQ